MESFNNINNLNSKLIKSNFIEICFNSVFYKKNVKFMLFENIECINTEYINSLLMINIKKPEINQNWLWHYYIPLSNKNNFLFLCYLKNIDNYVLNELNSKNIYTDFDIIIELFSSKINWKEENVKYHSFLWIDQQLVACYLDSVSGGLGDFLPFHWTKPIFMNKNNHTWCDNILWYHNVYLKINKLEDNEINMIDFIKKKLNKEL